MFLFVTSKMLLMQFVRIKLEQKCRLLCFLLPGHQFLLKDALLQARTVMLHVCITQTPIVKNLLSLTLEDRNGHTGIGQKQATALALLNICFLFTNCFLYFFMTMYQARCLMILCFALDLVVTLTFILPSRNGAQLLILIMEPIKLVVIAE